MDFMQKMNMPDDELTEYTTGKMLPLGSERDNNITCPYCGKRMVEVVIPFDDKLARGYMTCDSCKSKSPYVVEERPKIHDEIAKRAMFRASKEAVFENDPYRVVNQAFKNLYPDKECRIMWDVDLMDNEDEKVCGMTAFGNENEIPVIRVSMEIPAIAAIEILAHELAHVAAGETAGHGEEWEKAFENIFEEYIRVYKELLPDAEFKEIRCDE